MKRVLLFVVALLLALVGTGAVYAYVNKAEARAVAGQKPVSVLVAKAFIAAGTTGRAAKELMGPKLMPRSLVPPGALTNADSISAETAKTDIYPELPVLATQFGTPTTVPGSLNIPGDKVAMSVELLDEERVAGFVKPGSEVAIYATKDFDKPSAVTRLIIPRATVLAVGPTPDRGKPNNDKAGKNGQGGPILTTVLTVAVSAADGEKLAHASEIGAIYFALVSTNSSTSGASAPVDNDQVFGATARAR